MKNSMIGGGYDEDQQDWGGMMKISMMGGYDEDQHDGGGGGGYDEDQGLSG